MMSKERREMVPMARMTQTTIFTTDVIGEAGAPPPAEGVPDPAPVGVTPETAFVRSKNSTAKLASTLKAEKFKH